MRHSYYNMQVRQRLVQQGAIWCHRLCAFTRLIHFNLYYSMSNVAGSMKFLFTVLLYKL